MQNKIALLLVGSPKVFKSSSENIGKLMLGYLAKQGYKADIEHIGIVLRKGTMDELIQKVNTADITIISAPLYVDSLPAPLISFLEQYRDDKQKNDKKLVGIINSGFPESFHNNTALEILRLFAIQNGFNWTAGFAIGGGGAFGNINLEKSDMAEHIVGSFKSTAIQLSNGESVQKEVIEAASKSTMPISVYLFFGHLGWYLQSIKHRTLFKLRAKPYINGI